MDPLSITVGFISLSATITSTISNLLDLHHRQRILQTTIGDLEEELAIFRDAIRSYGELRSSVSELDGCDLPKELHAAERALSTYVDREKRRQCGRCEKRRQDEVEHGIFGGTSKDKEHGDQAADLERVSKELRKLYVAIGGNTQTHLRDHHEHNYNLGLSKTAADERKVKTAALIEWPQFLQQTACLERMEPAHHETFSRTFSKERENPSFSPNFAQWLRAGAGDGPLWIKGMAGSGKSAFMKLLSKEQRTNELLAERSQGEPYISSLVHFWSTDMDLQRPIIDLLRLILISQTQIYISIRIKAALEKPISTGLPHCGRDEGLLERDERTLGTILAECHGDTGKVLVTQRRVHPRRYYLAAQAFKVGSAAVLPQLLLSSGLYTSKHPVSLSGPDGDRAPWLLIFDNAGEPTYHNWSSFVARGVSGLARQIKSLFMDSDTVLFELSDPVAFAVTVAVTSLLLAAFWQLNKGLRAQTWLMLIAITGWLASSILFGISIESSLFCVLPRAVFVALGLGEICQCLTGRTSSAR